LHVHLGDRGVDVRADLARLFMTRAEQGHVQRGGRGSLCRAEQCDCGCED